MKRDLPKDRPPPLKISRPGDPHHLQHHHHHHRPQRNPPPQQQQQQYAHAPFRPTNPNYRPPVIIHTYSPEVIQIDSDNFRQLVQRLTGPAGQASPHAPPSPKRPRVAVSPPTGNFNPIYNSTQGNSSLNQSHLARHLLLSPPGALRTQQDAINPNFESSSGYGNLPHNSLLSPSMFDFSPSVLPSPSTFSFDFPSIVSPMGFRVGAGMPSPRAPGGASSHLSTALGGAPTPRSLAAALPSPGPLSASFLADLPVLSPAAYSWIEKNAATADAIVLSSRALMSSAGLPPRPPQTASTTNLFPSSSSLSPREDEKPYVYREK